MTDSNSGYFRRTVTGFGTQPDDSLQVTVKLEFAVANWEKAEPCGCSCIYVHMQQKQHKNMLCCCVIPLNALQLDIPLF
jgi:hypothetical protein